MAALQAAEVDRRLRLPGEFRHSRHGAFLDGFSLHAGVRIHGNDRDGRERLCRYLLRPPLSLQAAFAGRGGPVRLPDEASARGIAVPPPHARRAPGPARDPGTAAAGSRPEVPWGVRAELQGEEKGRAGRAGPRPGGSGDSGEDDGRAAAGEAGEDGTQVPRSPGRWARSSSPSSPRRRSRSGSSTTSGGPSCAAAGAGRSRPEQRRDGPHLP